LLTGELFYTLHEARVIVEGWRQRYNTQRRASRAGVSATRPRDSYLRTAQRVGVKELERWPNNWGLGRAAAGERNRRSVASLAAPERYFYLIPELG
jgi:hypothetical protein